MMRMDDALPANVPDKTISGRMIRQMQAAELLALPRAKYNQVKRQRNREGR